MLIARLRSRAPHKIPSPAFPPNPVACSDSAIRRMVLAPPLWPATSSRLPDLLPRSLWPPDPAFSTGLLLPLQLQAPSSPADLLKPLLLPSAERPCRSLVLLDWP
ncbi:Os04g0300100 [Oryza sativa Japonica Group]|uniref:Os04g0300100 protein n=2 Tax=Oryza sativa subsp. japonica TaxID=39947 RepID=C7J180_ORYSJ|nr:hypothetical protein EE612_022953 [Oryza sativa]KAF2933254.1 hypothetical protein DAI22_04g068100 [Oryza sativa Japonica Group]BAH92577.1 Os04g0300100 [Oryza sativa Japonica Group]BAS88461.1 Os04g0300100 [Oryza sativa Japonica Group]|eukprot:NP_001173849.1 Os04g0300100 [Oryza sativa Japonica Group]